MIHKVMKMRTIVILAVSLFFVSAASAQDTIKEKNKACHRFHIYYGMGYTNNIYEKIDKSFIHTNYSYSSALELKYACFFAPKWGISIGAGLSRFAAKGTLNIDGVIPHYNDIAFDPSGQRFYDLYYLSSNFVEKQQIWALEAPLQFHFEHHNGRNGVFVSLGAKGYFPIISARSIFPKGDLRVYGYEEFTNTWYDDPPHFGTQDVSNNTPAMAKLRISVDVVAEVGGVFRLNRNSDFYLGVYGSYGFLDVLPKAADKKDFITPEHNNNLNVNSLLASNFHEKYNDYVVNNNLNWKKANKEWKMWQVGLKVGIHLKPCSSGDKDKDKREYSSVGERSNSNNGRRTVIRDTVQIVHVYYVTPVNYKEDSRFTPSERESINALVSVLSNNKILFDLNSDVPKIENKSFIADVAQILRKETALSLEIEGYTCDLGTEEHNRELAIRRAASIRDLFIEGGVKSSQIEITAYTANDLENKLNIKEEAREEHRAVIFRIVKK